MQETAIHKSHVYGWIKIWRTIFEKGHPRNIPVKLFQNRTSGSRGEDIKGLLKKFHFVATATTVFDGIKFSEQV